MPQGLSLYKCSARRRAYINLRKTTSDGALFLKSHSCETDPRGLGYSRKELAAVHGWLTFREHPRRFSYRSSAYYTNARYRIHSVHLSVIGPAYTLLFYRNNCTYRPLFSPPAFQFSKPNRRYGIPTITPLAGVLKCRFWCEKFAIGLDHIISQPWVIAECRTSIWDARLSLRR